MVAENEENIIATLIAIFIVSMCINFSHMIWVLVPCLTLMWFAMVLNVMSLNNLTVEPQLSKPFWATCGP